MSLFSSNDAETDTTVKTRETTKNNSAIVEDQGINVTDGAQLGSVNQRFVLKAKDKSKITGNTFITESLDGETVAGAFEFGSTVTTNAIDLARDFATQNGTVATDALTLASSSIKALSEDRADARESAEGAIIDSLGKSGSVVAISLVILGGSYFYFKSRK